MKNESAYSKKFSALLRRIKKSVGETDAPPELDPIGRLMLGFLQWESNTGQARAAYGRLTSVMVDYNDLRVSHPQEIALLLGPRYPLVRERSHGLLNVLQEVYFREHEVTMDRLVGKPKKEVRAYLDSLPGMVQYVSAQVTLLSFGGHAVPVDEALAGRLRDEGVVDPQATVEQIGSFLERQIRASDSAQAHGLLRAWVDAGPSGRKQGASKKDAPKKTTTKSTKKATQKTTVKKKAASSGSGGKASKKSAARPAKKPRR